jgi:hypothetical protein
MKRRMKKYVDWYIARKKERKRGEKWRKKTNN